MIPSTVLLICLATATPPRGQEVIDRVLAVVAGELIMQSDVIAARDFGLVVVNEPGDPTRAVLDRLIERALILAEVSRYAPPEPDAEDVDRAMQPVRARFATPEAFEAALARTGLEERHLRQRLRQDLRIQAYLDQRFTVVPATEDELARYYREHAERFSREGAQPPFDQIRPEVVQAVNAERRRALVDEWIDGLRRRTAILDFYGAVPSR